MSKYDDEFRTILKGLPAPPLSKDLKKWWHEILRNYGRYSCYAIMLALPSDTEVVNYLRSFGKELDLISGEDCLLIALTMQGFWRFGFDYAIMEAAFNEQVSEGYSLEVAKVLQINLTDFPSLVIFDDIRSKDFVLVQLKGLSVEAIAERMREIFVVIQDANSKKEKPIPVLKRYLNIEVLRHKSRSTLKTLSEFGGRTFEKAMEAWINARIK
jgi:hypothetical protein